MIMYWTPTLHIYIFCNFFISVLTRGLPQLIVTTYAQLTNTLQKKLDQVRAEKAQLEKQIEREQNSRSDLKIKLSDLRKNSPACEQVPEEKEEEAEGEEAATAPDAAAVTSES